MIITRYKIGIFNQLTKPGDLGDSDLWEITEQLDDSGGIAEQVTGVRISMTTVGGITLPKLESVDIQLCCLPRKYCSVFSLCKQLPVTV